jgi:hypothetical protein
MAASLAAIHCGQRVPTRKEACLANRTWLLGNLFPRAAISASYSPGIDHPTRASTGPFVLRGRQINSEEIGRPSKPIARIDYLRRRRAFATRSDKLKLSAQKKTRGSGKAHGSLSNPIR